MGWDFDKLSGWHVRVCAEALGAFARRDRLVVWAQQTPVTAWQGCNTRGMASGSCCNRGLPMQKKEVHYCAQLEEYLILAYFCIAAFKKGRKEPFVPVLRI